MSGHRYVVYTYPYGFSHTISHTFSHILSLFFYFLFFLFFFFFFFYFIYNIFFFDITLFIFLKKKKMFKIIFLSLISMSISVIDTKRPVYRVVSPNHIQLLIPRDPSIGLYQLTIFVKIVI